MTGAIIETERLRLAPLAQDEMEDLHLLWTRPEVRRYLWDGEFIPEARTTEILRQNAGLFAREGYGLWGVHRKDSPVLQGFGGFWHFRDPPELELILGFRSTAWNKGFATEAGAALVRYAFEALGFDEVRGSTDAPNERSARLMQRLGMQFERREVVGGLDTVFYSILRSAWSPSDASYHVETSGD
ncbi:MAG TPA: GNAT family N-acetyltransferase [Longimicrobiaceae bacterium]|nr:GNAT family N-acetyltransferase [Longimicrobiaceae bacterium]